MGVAPAEDGEFRTRPPGIFGGNMDVRELCTGATLYLPVQNPGALFSAGDAHAAQGDGEVCINGIECPVDATLALSAAQAARLAGPLVESAPRHEAGSLDADAWIVVESATDATAAARAATSRMIDLLVDRWGFQRRPRLPALQRGDALEVQPGGERADVHRERLDAQARAAAKEAFLACHAPNQNPMKINDPETLAELQALYPQYETALVTNDVETLTRMFWASPHAMRFGVTENLYGIDEIEAFRKGRSPANLARTVRRLDIVDLRQGLRQRHAGIRARA